MKVTKPLFSFFAWCIRAYVVRYGVKPIPLPVPKSLEFLEQSRDQVVSQIAALRDLRRGSITATKCRCGKSNHCHHPNDPGHGPNLRLTYKVNGKTITESLPDPKAMRMAEREIAEFRKLEGLHKELVAINAQICQIRPIEAGTASQEEKKHPALSTKKSLGK